MGGASNIWLGDSRLAAHALSPAPAWLWSADATRVLWANPNGAAILQAGAPDAIGDLRFDPEQGAAAQIARLAGTLPHGAMPRLERLRGFGAGIGNTLTCICSRFENSGGEAAVLVVATERAGPDLPLDERLRQMIGTLGDAVAAFSADGDLLLASPAAHTRLGSATTLDQLGAESLARTASRDGHAAGRIASADVTLERLSAGNTVVLLMTMSGEAPVTEQSGVVAEPAAAPVAATAPAASSLTTTAAVEPPRLKRQSLRFVWHSDTDDRFVLESEEFVGFAGWTTKAALGSPWRDFAQALGIDGDGRVSQALASRQTWSGIPLEWPVDRTTERVTIELSGLPVIGREQNFEGYRGFGICRDAARLTGLARQRDEAEAAKARAEAEAKALADKADAKAAAESKAVSDAAAAAKAADEAATHDDAAVNVVPFRAQEAPSLDPREQKAFSEIARELSDRLKKNAKTPLNDDDFGPERHEPIADPLSEPPPVARAPARDKQSEHAILDRLPLGILVYRLNDLLYANRAFLEWTDYPTLDALREAGGLDSLFIETNSAPAGTAGARNGTPALTITTPGGKRMPVEGRLFPASWNGENALVLMLNITKAADKTADLALRRIEDENRELTAVLDTATDGVVMVDRDGRILSANRSAEALLGYEPEDFTKLGFGDLFAPESRRTVLDYLDRLARDTGIALLNEGREVIGLVRQGGLVPLYVTIGRIGGNSDKFCAVFRDVTSWKRTEEDLINAKRQAESASSAKSEFLAKISHEIRTPLNAIIGFSEVMMDEQFGPVGNERYRQYLRDIHASGGHLIALLNDLLDLSKIEAGKLDLTFTGVNLNDIAQQCVAILQQQANRERVIIRTSLPAGLPQIVADARSVRQIVLNLLSNSIKFTGAGGQVIVSTSLSDRNEVVLHVRDTGGGMSPQELQAALEPFRQLATSARWGSSGTGLGLPITKALAEANHGKFTITSTVAEGTLVEVAFPAPRVLAK